MTYRPPAVVKFGGAALSDPTAVVQRLRVLGRGGRPMVAVVSARAGVTDRLAACVRSTGDATLHAQTLRAIRRLHPGANAAWERRFSELHRALGWCERRGRLELAGADKLLAFGEQLAVDWLVPRLRVAGLPAVGVDAAQLGLWTDGRYGAGTILLDRSRRPVRTRLHRMLAAGQLPIVTGYFGRGARGEPVTLGRGGSDYAASAIGSLLGAEFVELVKRGASVLSADPRLVPSARPVRYLSFAEAEELAEFGARVLHPLTVEPARLAGVEIRVRSSEDPRSATVIGPTVAGDGVRAVTASPIVLLWRLRFPGGRGRAGVLAELGTRLAAAGVPVLQAFTSAAVVSVVVDAGRAGPTRKALVRLVTERGAHLEGPIRVCLLAAVGAGAIRALPAFPTGLLAEARGVSATRASVTMALPAQLRVSAVRALHAALIERPPPPGSRRRAGRRAFGPAASRPARPSDGARRSRTAKVPR